MSPVDYGPEPRVLSELKRAGPPACGHEQDGAVCGSRRRIRHYLIGPRCPQHTPAAIAGHTEPGRTATRKAS